MAWLQEVAHWSGLLPIAAVAVLACRSILCGQSCPGWRVRLLAVAFAISFLVDLVAGSLQAQNLPNLWLTYLLAPVQFGLLLLVVAPARYNRVVWLGFWLIVLASMFRGTFGNIETFTHIAVGAWICLVIHRQPIMEPYRPGIMVYCGATIPALLVMGFATPSVEGPWVGAWLAYQVVRIVGLVMIARAVLHYPRIRLVRNERTDSTGHSSRASGGGHPVSGIARGHRHVRTA